MIIVSSPISYLTSHGGCKLMGGYGCPYSDMGLKGWGEGPSSNSNPVAYVQLIKTIWTINLKLFCIQSQKRRASIATVCLKTQFVLWPFKYQRR